MPLEQTTAIAILTVGSLLMILEAIIPGASFIVVGITLLITGFIALIVPIPNILWLIPVAMTVGIITMYSYVNLEIYGEEKGKTTDSSDLDYKLGYVTEKVTETEGKVELKESKSIKNGRSSTTGHRTRGSSRGMIFRQGVNMVRFQKVQK